MLTRSTTTMLVAMVDAKCVQNTPPGVVEGSDPFLRTWPSICDCPIDLWSSPRLSGVGTTHKLAILCWCRRTSPVSPARLNVIRSQTSSDKLRTNSMGQSTPRCTTCCIPKGGHRSPNDDEPVSADQNIHTECWVAHGKGGKQRMIVTMVRSISRVVSHVLKLAEDFLKIQVMRKEQWRPSHFDFLSSLHYQALQYIHKSCIQTPSHT